MTGNGATPDPRELELYKIAIEMADRISARRATSNSFFLAVQSALIAVLGLAAPSLAARPWWTSLTVAVAGIALSASWWLQLRSYRDLNRAKFGVINMIEERLPYKIFSDEWRYLKQDRAARWRGRYTELGTVERFVPWVFAMLYVLLFIGRLTK